MYDFVDTCQPIRNGYILYEVAHNFWVALTICSWNIDFVGFMCVYR